jgi:hypothetical protein
MTEPTVDTSAAEAWQRRWPEAAALLAGLMQQTAVVVVDDDDDWLFAALAMMGHRQAADELKAIWWQGKPDADA